MFFLFFPFQVLGKSCKPIPVMLMGAFLGKKYPLKKYVNVALIVFGVALFMQSGSGAGKPGGEDGGQVGVYGCVGGCAHMCGYTAVCVHIYTYMSACVPVCVACTLAI